MTVDFAAGVVAPTVVAKAMLDPGTKVAAFERCNLHGVWVAETTVCSSPRGAGASIRLAERDGAPVPSRDTPARYRAQPSLSRISA